MQMVFTDIIEIPCFMVSELVMEENNEENICCFGIGIAFINCKM